MFGLGNIIGGAMKIGGAIFGGIKASKAAREQQRHLQQQQHYQQQQQPSYQNNAVQSYSNSTTIPTVTLQQFNEL